jgi:hypothetical protein
MWVQSAGNRPYTVVDDENAKAETAAWERKSAAQPRRKLAGASGASTEALSRTKRGPVLTKNAGLRPFRAFRGGDALRASAWSYYRFDQADYADRTGPNGICQGWVRLALSRLDDPQTADITDAVRRIQGDVNNHGGFIAEDTIARARYLQKSTEMLRLRRYIGTVAPQMNGSRGGRIRQFFESARQYLGEGGVAHIALGLNSPGTNTGTKGHVLLLQRLPRGRYALFDPNNGVMTYSNRRDMEAGLRKYMNESFQDTGMQLSPDSVQFYALPAPSADGGAPHEPVQAPDRPQVRPEPPLTSSTQPDLPTREALATHADESNSLSTDMLSGAAGRPDAMSGLDRGLAAVALRDIAQGHSSNLTDATENLRRGLTDPVQRQVSLDEIRDLQRENRFGVVEPLPGYARRRGTAGMRSSVDLIADLREHFCSLHASNDASVGYQTDLAVINLSMRRGTAGDQGQVNVRDGTGADGVPIVVQRLHEGDDFVSDQYELYEPGSGVYRYSTFSELTNALRGVFEVGFGAFGGVEHADTTYYANLATPMAASGGAAAAPASSGIANLDLTEIEQRFGIVNANARVTPRPDLPPPPVRIEPKLELKR